MKTETQYVSFATQDDLALERKRITRVEEKVERIEEATAKALKANTAALEKVALALKQLGNAVADVFIGQQKLAKTYVKHRVHR